MKVCIKILGTIHVVRTHWGEVGLVDLEDFTYVPCANGREVENMPFFPTYYMDEPLFSILIIVSELLVFDLKCYTNHVLISTLCQWAYKCLGIEPSLTADMADTASWAFETPWIVVAWTCALILSLSGAFDALYCRNIIFCLYFFFSLLDSTQSAKCDRFKHAYANILFQWEQVKQRAELLGYLSSRALDENSRFSRISLVLSYSINTQWSDFQSTHWLWLNWFPVFPASVVGFNV